MKNGWMVVVSDSVGCACCLCVMYCWYMLSVMKNGWMVVVQTQVEFVYPAVCDDWKVNFMKYIFVYYAVCLSNCSSSRDAAKNVQAAEMLPKI